MHTYINAAKLHIDEEVILFPEKIFLEFLGLSQQHEATLYALSECLSLQMIMAVLQCHKM